MASNEFRRAGAGRRQWLLVVSALVFAAVADRLSESPIGSVSIYVLAALPGLLAFLVWRSLLASAFVSLVPGYFVIGELTEAWPRHAPEVALDRLVPLQPAWVFVYASLYVFIGFLPLLVVRQRELFRRALKAYLFVMIVAYVGFLLYPVVAPRPEQVLGEAFSAWSLLPPTRSTRRTAAFLPLHVAYSFVSALTCSRVHRGVGAAAQLWAALIGVSTLFTKQHYVVDVVAGALAAYVAYLLFLRGHPREAIAEGDRRRAPVRALYAVGIFGNHGFRLLVGVQAVSDRSAGERGLPPGR